MPFCTNDGADSGADIGTHHVDRWCRCPETYPVSAALFDDLRLFQRHFLLVGHYDAIAGSLHFPQCRFDFGVFFLNAAQFQQDRQQIVFSVDLQSGSFAQDAVKQGTVQFHFGADAAGSHVDLPDAGTCHIGTGADSIGKQGSIPDGADLRCRLADAGKDRFPQPVVFFQRGDPLGHTNVDFPDWKDPEQFCENVADVRLVQVRAADRQHRGAVLFRQLFCHCLCLCGVRIHTVEQDGKGLTQLLQFCNHTLLAFGVFGTGQICDAAVCRDD